MISPPPVLRPRETPSFRRFTDAELAQLTQAPSPRNSRLRRWTNCSGRPTRHSSREFFEGMPESLQNQVFERYDQWLRERAQLLATPGVTAVLVADERARDTQLAVPPTTAPARQ